MILEYEKDNLWKIGDVGDMKWDDTTPTTIVQIADHYYYYFVRSGRMNAKLAFSFAALNY